MRVFFALGLVSLTVAGVACGGSHAAPDARGARDALGLGDAPQPAIDAAVDAAVDAAIDAPPDAPETGLVTITVYDATHVPAPGVPVVFQDPDGSVVSEASTDAQGMASATMEAGGSVTCHGGPAANTLYTFTAVKPGDQLLVGTAGPPATFQVSFKLPAVANAYEYSVQTRCGSGGAGSGANPVATVGLSCSPVDLYVSAKDQTVNHFTMAAFYKANVSVASGDTIDLTGETYQPLATTTIEVDNVPPQVTTVSASIELWDGKFLFENMIAGLGLASGKATGSVPLPQLAGLDMQARVVLSAYPQPGVPSSQEVRQNLPLSTAYTLDATANAIAWIPNGVRYDIAGSQVAWTEAAGALTADYARAEVQVTRTSSNTTTYFVREIAGPYTPGHLTVPVLPDSLAIYDLQPGDNPVLNKFYLARVPEGWDGSRPGVFDLKAFLPPGFALGDTAIASGAQNGIIVREHGTTMRSRGSFLRAR